MGKRAEQINAEIRTELHQKLDEFAVHNSTLEEVLKTENKLRFLRTTKDYQNQLQSQFRNGWMVISISVRQKRETKRFTTTFMNIGRKMFLRHLLSYYYFKFFSMANSLHGRKVLVGVTGGIAAYKIHFLIRELVKTVQKCR